MIDVLFYSAVRRSGIILKSLYGSINFKENMDIYLKKQEKRKASIFCICWPL